jgi:hypothetical protein
MNATLSTRQLRLVILLVGIVVLAGGYLVVSRHKSASPSTASSTPAATTPAQTTPTQTTPSHTVAPVRVASHGLPVPVVTALLKHSIVVVSLSSPRGADDVLAAGEAQAAAIAMKAGYVNIDVNHQRPGTALLRKLGVFSTPATLVVKRDTVYSNFNGFVDRGVVEQAVADARS